MGGSAALPPSILYLFLRSPECSSFNQMGSWSRRFPCQRTTSQWHSTCTSPTVACLDADWFHYEDHLLCWCLKIITWSAIYVAGNGRSCNIIPTSKRCFAHLVMDHPQGLRRFHALLGWFCVCITMFCINKTSIHVAFTLHIIASCRFLAAMQFNTWTESILSK